MFSQLSVTQELNLDAHCSTVTKGSLAAAKGSRFGAACTLTDSDGVLPIGSYLVFPLNDSLKQTLLGAVERKAARQEDEEDDSAPPHIHRFAVRLPLDYLWGHEVGSTDSP